MEMARASACHAEGRQFKSDNPLHIFPLKKKQIPKNQNPSVRNQHHLFETPVPKKTSTNHFSQKFLGRLLPFSRSYPPDCTKFFVVVDNPDTQWPFRAWPAL
ncbi:MAG: hypothetical protein HQK52_12880 [Oligoflexia bacterium]|nr:hypothetical protein [Oligoflexia bacterium]